MLWRVSECVQQYTYWITLGKKVGNMEEDNVCWDGVKVQRHINNGPIKVPVLVYQMKCELKGAICWVGPV